MPINLEINTTSQATKDNIVRGLFSADTESELKTKVRGLAGTPRTLTILRDTSGIPSAYSLTSLPNNFKDGDLSVYNVQIGNDVTSIGNDAFRGCINLQGPTSLPGSVTSIGSYAFAYTNIGNIVLPDSCVTIGNGAFRSLTGGTSSLIIPDRCTTIGSNAFYYNNNLTGTQRIPQTLTSIGSGAFRYTGITRLVLPSVLPSIGANAFRDCLYLTRLYVECNAADFQDVYNNAFFNVSLTTIYYKAGAVGWTNPWFGIPTAVWTNYPNPTP